MDFSELKSKISEAEKIVIYGCGVYGRQVYTFLDINGFLDKLLHFAVSDTKNNPKQFMNTPVCEFNSDLYDKDTLFIVAIKYSPDNIIKMLMDYGFNNIVIINADLLKQLYLDNYNLFSSEPIVKNKIFFNSYNGLGYGCNPKYIAEEIIKQKLNIDMVWVVRKNNTYRFPKKIRTVLFGTKEFYKELSTSAIIIENGCYLHEYPKKDNQYCIETWHGCAPLKKIASDTDYKCIKTNKNIDLYLAGTEFYAKQFRKAFLYEGEIVNTGCPRDDLFYNNIDVKNKVYEYYNIPKDKKVVLYAPTFRDDYNLNGYGIDINLILKAINEYYNDEFIFAYRMHRNLHKCGIIFELDNPIAIDMTYYDDVQELLASFDVLITDYSSIMWDFSLTKKPVFLFQTDAEKYELERGFYTPFSELPYPIGHSNEELCEKILNFDEEKYIKDITAFHDKNVVFDDGHASERAVEIIKKRLEM